MIPTCNGETVTRKRLLSVMTWGSNWKLVCNEVCNELMRECIRLYFQYCIFGKRMQGVVADLVLRAGAGRIAVVRKKASTRGRTKANVHL